MFKKCKVVMLTTKEKAQIHIIPEGYMYKSVEAFIQASQAYKSYHLYIISDDVIKEGDWVYNSFYKTVYQWIKNTSIKFDKIDAKKIIATTDSSLSSYLPEDINKVGAEYNLPQPSQSFIEKYIEEYNKNNIITDVMVECEKYCTHLPCKEYPNGIFDFKVKINSKDNTITIKKVKDSWTREEVIELLHKKDLYGNCNTDEEFANWIDENI